MFDIKENTRVFLCPTDTVYGLSARVDDEDAIERIRQLKGKKDARFIILISDIEQLNNFSVQLTDQQKKLLNKIWPGPVTVAFDDKKAFRVPNYLELINLINEIGPIISTSANKHGENPIKTIVEAKEVFGDKVDEYIDGGLQTGESSTVIKIIR